MPKLILSMDGLVLKEIVLDKERTSIGRKPSNDIQIDNLAISGQHAVITRILDDAFLEDQNSTNGTYVNGQPIKKHVLGNNDVIELGKYRLKYIVDAAPARTGSVDVVEPVALKSFDLDPLTQAPLASAAADAARTQVFAAGALEQASATAVEALGVIQVLSGANAGRELELSKSLTTLGKPGRQVAVITRRAHGYFITHVEGANFPLINGKALGAQAQLLHDHDIVELAGVKMEFFLRA